MPTNPAHYTAAITTDLTERTAYEAWLLESVYDLTNQPIAVSHNDNLVYSANGGTPQTHHFITVNMIIGDWKPKFLEAGTPLVFVTTYKVLDMMMEWVLHQNIRLFRSKVRGRRLSWRLAWLASGVIIPV